MQIADGSQKGNYLIFSACYPPHTGGVERYSEAIATELAKRGYQVYVVTSGSGSSVQQEGKNPAVLRIPSLMLLDGRMPVPRSLRAWKQAKGFLSTIREPRVIIQTFLYPLSLMGAMLAGKRQWPAILINHGCDYVCQGSGLIDRLEHRYERIMAGSIAKKVRSSYAVSEDACRWAERCGLQAAGVLHNSVDSGETEKESASLPWGIREAYGIPENSFVVAFVGRMIREKGIVQLTAAAERLIREGMDLTLIAAGGGELLEEMKKHGTERIHFTGNLPHGEVLRILRESDCCCLPSDAEGLPTVLMEASLCGCYLIGSPYGGTKDVIGEWGTLMDGNRESDICTAIREAGEMTNRKEIAQKNRQRIQEQFSWKTVCDRLEMIDWGKK